MIAQYHELQVMAAVGQPGRKATLNDLHRKAWGIYTGTGKMEVPKGVERPFIFRADEIPGRPGIYLFALRSAYEFAKSKPLTIDLSEGKRLSLEYHVAPSKTAVVNGKNRRVTAPNDEWESIGYRQLEKAGMRVDSLTVDKLGTLAFNHIRTSIPMALVNAEVVVSNAIEATNFWTHGIAPMRGYGTGLLTILPESHQQPEVA